MQNPYRVVRVKLPGFSTCEEYEVDDEKMSGTASEFWAWCAVNPWNGLLYTSRFTNATEIYAYEFVPSEKLFRAVDSATIPLAVAAKRVQGGCFTDNGHLVLACDVEAKALRVYSVLNGAYLGECKIAGKSNLKMELEGITMLKSLVHGDVHTQLHVIFLDADWGRIDDVFFQHYHVPSADKL